MRLAYKTCIWSFIVFCGCNLLKPLDNPSGDLQILAAARACFDHGDYQCASDFYAQASNAVEDEKISEMTFLALAQYGIPVNGFADAVIDGSSSAGNLITSLTNVIAPRTDLGQTLRLAYFHAYQNYKLIHDTKIQGLIRFVGAISILGEIFAEDSPDASSGSRTLNKYDLVSNPTLCLANPLTTLPPLPGCSKPTGKTIISGTATIDLTTASDSDLSGAPTLLMVNAAISEVLQGITLMGKSGDVGNASASFATTILTAAQNGAIDTGDSTIYRKFLIDQGIGAN